MNDDRKSFIESALDYASHEARHWMADALACHLHNDGYALEGNTEANDVDWFARNLADHARSVGWDRLEIGEQEYYRATAKVVLAVLPDYQLRVAHRLITLSKVVRDIERAERNQRKKTGPASSGTGT